jgi:hypothetical protein
VDDPLPRRLVERRQLVPVQLQGHLLGGAGSELELGEPLELPGRLLRFGRCHDVQLDDLGAGAAADVGDLDRDRDHPGRLVVPEAGLAVRVLAVGEPVAEAEQRLLAALVVPAVADEDASS